MKIKSAFQILAGTHLVALFSIVKECNDPRCSLILKRIKVQYTHKIEYYLDPKKSNRYSCKRMNFNTQIKAIHVIQRNTCIYTIQGKQNTTKQKCAGLSDS